MATNHITNAISDPDGVATPSEAVLRLRCEWQLIDDLMGGTLAMRAARRRHLPQWPSEECDAYDCRIQTAVLFPAYSRTVSILTGKPFSKPITIGDDVPERIETWLGDVDQEGRNLDSFMAGVCGDALGYGITGIFVDVPRSNGARTIADETAAGIRPYFVHVKHDAILGWKAERQNGAMKLTQLRILETVEEDGGRFATELVRQVRVLEPGRWEIHRIAKNGAGGGAWEIHDEGATMAGGVPLDVIPFIPIYGFRKDYMIGVPPMLDLAYLNAEHWRSSSDQQNILHVARVPILLLKGFAPPADADEKRVIGAGSTIVTDNENASALYIEHGGAAIDAGRTSILDLEDRMRQIGAELLVIKPGNTTEVQTRSDNEPAMCDLQRIMQSMEDGVDLALSYMAKFAGEKTGGHIDIYSDFGVASQSDASSQLLTTMHTDGALCHATLLNELKRRGVLSPDIDVDDEINAANLERDQAQAASAAREQAMLYGHGPTNDQAQNQDSSQNPPAAGADASAA